MVTIKHDQRHDTVSGFELARQQTYRQNCCFSINAIFWSFINGHKTFHGSIRDVDCYRCTGLDGPGSFCDTDDETFLQWSGMQP